MRTVRDHSESKRVDLYPQTRTCPGCHQPLKEKYHKQRWIVQLSGQLQVVSHCLGCANTQCSHIEAVYRSIMPLSLSQRLSPTGMRSGPNTQEGVKKESASNPSGRKGSCPT